MRNWKNVSLTLAEKHQLRQSFDWILSQNESDIIIGTKKMIATSKHMFNHLFPREDTLVTINWVQINHVKYTANQCFIPVGLEEGLSLFAEVHKILWRNEETIFVCKKVKTIEHNMQLMTYQIIVTDKFVLFTPDNLVFHCISLTQT